MIIRLGNCWSTVAAATPEEASWLFSLLSYSDMTELMERCPFTGRQIRKILREPDGRTPQLDSLGKEIIAPLPRLSCLDPSRGRFPAGLTGHVQTCATGSLDVQILDERVKPGIEPDFEILNDWWGQMVAAGKEQRDYQVDSIVVGLKLSRGIFDLCTGAGKTLTSMGLVAALPGVKWIFLVPKDMLYHQAIETYEATFPGEKCGRIRGKKFIDGDFIVTTYQTLSARIKRGCPETLALIPHITGLFVDECHGTAARTQYEAVQALENTYYRFGLSGTPLDRGDDKNKLNVGALGRILKSVTTKQLVDRGVLARPIVTSVPCVQSGVTSRDWRVDYDKFITYSADRMWLLMDVILKYGEAPGFIFCTSPEHGRNIERVIKALGFRTMFIWGPSKTWQRKEGLKKVASGEIDYLIGSSILDVGIDVPSIRFMLFAGGRKGKIAHVQKIGRGVRKDPDTGKFEVRIFDIFDMMDPDAPPHMTGNKSNANHTKERARLYREQGWDVQAYEG